MSLIVISHRANLNGPNPDTENHPDQIRQAIYLGLDVEVDVWYEQKKWYLGHDKPQYQIGIEFLIQKGLWLHAKNTDALYHLNNMGTHEFSPFPRVNCFYHDIDDMVLTSKGYIWAHPSSWDKLTPHSIWVLPPDNLPDLVKIGLDYGPLGVCTDRPELFRNSGQFAKS